MDRRDLLLGAVGAAAITASTSGAAEAQDAKQAVEKAFKAWQDALSALDLNKMMAVWGKGADTVLLNPRDKAAAIGNDAVKKRWEETFAFWQSLKVVDEGSSTIAVMGNTAYRYGTESVAGKTKAGQDMSFKVLVTSVFAKADKDWQMMCHHASAVPT